MKSCLSIQSHVTHGYVGNRAAVFPLQLRGWDIDVLNTVQLSNNTGYGSWTGTKATANEIWDIYKGLKEKKFDYNALLTGYVPSAEGLETIGEIGRDLKTRFPDAMWLLDPVMGDDGKLYVSENVIPVYKDILRRGGVTLITPNAFEAEILCDKRVVLNSKDSIKQALEILHNEYGVEHVVLSSCSLGDKLVTVGSTKGKSPFCFEYEALDSYFTGTGDLFAALMVDEFKECQGEEYPLKAGVANALGTVNSVLIKTMEHKIANGVSHHGIKGDPEAMKNAELQLIESRRVIMGVDETPKKFVPAEF